MKNTIKKLKSKTQTKTSLKLIRDKVTTDTVLYTTTNKQ